MKNFMRGKSYEFSISPGMLFKKMYCCKCGEKLKREFFVVGYSEDEGCTCAGFSGSILSFSYRPPRTTEYQECFYVCHGCNYAISYDDQKMVAEYQKESGKKILTEKQMAFLNHVFENDFK